MSVRILQGDCREVLSDLGEDGFDSCVTDPPYELGFMGRAWDKSGVAFDPATWAEVLRVLKPGGYLLAFGGTRTYHRMACAVEDAGFEIRDQIGWLFGSGFPKSHNGAWGGTALKPAWEPIVMARKPLIGTVEQNWRAHGTGALNIDGCRIPAEPMPPNTGRGALLRRHPEETREPGQVNQPHDLGRWPANLIHDGSDEVLEAFPDAPGQLAAASSSSSSRKNQHVYGAMRRGNGRDGETSAGSQNIGAVGFQMKPGARRGDAGSAARFFYSPKASRKDRNEGLHGMPESMPHGPSGDGRAWDIAGSHAKPRANHHPTVKPTDLMRYLCRLVTPAGGLVLDPFMGSGSTLKAAELEGFNAIGVELDPQYIEIARRRIAADAPLFADLA